MENTQIAQIAWSQIPVMSKMRVGAREPTAHSDGKLTFKVHSKPYRYVEVKLNGGDLYDVTYFRLKRGSFERVTLDSREDIFNDMLGEVIDRMVNSE